jgi:hypothetical protein
MDELIEVQDIKVEKGMTVDELIKQMSMAGGFTAQKLADSVDIIENMMKDKDCLKILSFPACIMATGTRGIIVDMVRNGCVDVIITTCGTLDHDLSRTWAAYSRPAFSFTKATILSLCSGCPTISPTNVLICASAKGPALTIAPSSGMVIFCSNISTPSGFPTDSVPV